MKLKIEDVVICLALLLSFSTTLLMAIANESWGTHFPSSLIAFFAAVGVAALIYRFLGGSEGSEFRMGVLKVTGSAAILFGATWLLGDRIRDESILYRSDKEFRTALAGKGAEITRKTILLAQTEADLAKATKTNINLTDKVERLEARVADLSAQRSTYAIDQVRRMKPDDTFVSSIRRMIANEDEPFGSTLRDMDAKVTLNDAMTNVNVYRICVDTQDALFRGLETQKDRLRLRRNSTDGDTLMVDAVRGGTIKADVTVCPQNGPRTFDIQITCADAVKLFPDRIARCTGLKPVYQPGFTTIRGEKVTLGALPPR